MCLLIPLFTNTLPIPPFYRVVKSSSSLYSLVCSLSVTVPPSSIGIIGRESVTALEGSSYNISCTAEGSNPPVTLVWTKDGAAVSRITVFCLTQCQHSVSLVHTLLYCRWRRAWHRRAPSRAAVRIYTSRPELCPSSRRKPTMVPRMSALPLVTWCCLRCQHPLPWMWNVSEIPVVRLLPSSVCCRRPSAAVVRLLPLLYSILSDLYSAGHCLTITQTNTTIKLQSYENQWLQSM